jgi:hypothetical protein
MCAVPALTTFALTAFLAMTAPAAGADAPRFRGPAGDGKFHDKGLLKTWPEAGPKLAWTAKGLGAGSVYCSPVLAAAGDRRVILARLAGMVAGIDADAGTVLWQHKEDGSPAEGIAPVLADGQVPRRRDRQ